MPATATRAQFIRNEFRSLTYGPVTEVQTAFGELARRTKEPIPTFFENVSDTQAMCTERMSLLSASRRRMEMTVSGEQTGMDIALTTATPTVTMIDDDRGLNRAALVSAVTIDFGKETTTLELWG